MKKIYQLEVWIFLQNAPSISVIFSSAFFCAVVSNAYWRFTVPLKSKLPPSRKTRDESLVSRELEKTVSATAWISRETSIAYCNANFQLRRTLRTRTKHLASSAFCLTRLFEIWVLKFSNLQSEYTAKLSILNGIHVVRGKVLRSVRWRFTNWSFFSSCQLLKAKVL